MFNKLGINPILGQDIINSISVNKKLFAKFNNKTILISGVTGLVGSHLAMTFALYSYLNNESVKIIGLVRDLNKAKEIFGGLFANINFVNFDINEDLKIDDKVDFIFHTIAVTDSREITEFPVESLDTMYFGTKKLLDLARDKKSKFLYLSSMEVYGVTNPAQTKISEKDIGYIDIGNVRNVYSEGKRVCEMLVRSYAEEYGLKGYNARLAQTFGSGTSSQDSRVFADFARSALHEKPLIIKSTGKSVGNYVDIGDALIAFLMILISGKPGEAYNIVNENLSMTIYDLAKLVSELISEGRSKVLIATDINKSKNFAPDTTMHLSSSKIRELGWSPTSSLKDMFSKMVQSWSNQAAGKDLG
ncbi:NAD-dependent epimerase/dehydratase family protein [Oenococcus sicerae]|uniref:NAD(P)-dependent oxidoreductase n=1 Tax=Oenococcus sicerae TaxID=2203724 RepID=A0AAJ1VMK3_9LACO|nr:NAD(P)-dependent oxidoreductase [Oenococcus sicerae]MDN6900653.1 NAD(P)-dependent oxidoreductase [Oenococcus sicerae]